MNYYLATKEMITKAISLDDKPLGKPLRNPTGLTPEHCHWMLLQIQINHDWSDSKKGRWLGWAQAILCGLGYFNLEEMKALNQACSCEDEGCPHYNTTHIHQGVS